MFDVTQYITSLVLIIGFVLLVVGFVSSFIPVINKYKMPIQVIGIVIFSFGIYSQGKIVVEKEYKLKVAELQVKLKEAEAKAETVNTQIVTEVVTRREIVKEKGNDVIKYIDREVVKYNETCPISDALIKAHNAAALNKSVDEIITPNTIVNTTSHNKAVNTPKQMVLPKK
jgi:hypothetical protein